jgi:dihydrofolate reductase
MISLIAAMADNGVIGIENRLPWKLPADMQWFRKHTLGKPVIMGRKTFESLGRPLPDRTNIVLSRDPSFQAEGCIIVDSIDAALQAAAEIGDETMIMGGASFYEQMLPRAGRLYLTRIHADFEGDAWFPDVDMSQWHTVVQEDHQADEKNAYDYSFMILERHT